MSDQSTLGEFGGADTIERAESGPIDDKLYTNEEWLREQYVGSRRAMTDIADELGCSASTVGRYIRKFDIETRSPSETKTNEQTRKLRNKDWVREQYVEKRRSLSEIGDQLNVTPSTVSPWLQRHNIPRRSNSASQHDAYVIEKLNDAQWLREEYINKNRSTVEIADDLDVSSSTISQRLGTHDIPILNSIHSEATYNRLRDSEWMYKRYVEDRASTTEIASQLECSATTVSKWLSEHDIAVRSHQESKLPEKAVGKLQNADWLREQYHDNRKTLTEIGNDLDVSGRAVGLRLEAHGIEPRAIGETKLNQNALTYLRDAEWLREQYIDNERGTVDIAEEIGAADSTVRDWLRKHEIEIRSISEIQAEGDVEKLQDETWMRTQYIEREKSASEIADATEMGYGAVRDWLRRHSIEIRPQVEGNNEKLRNEEWLREQYVDEKRPMTDIADKLGLSNKTIPYWLDKYDIETRSYIEYIDRLGHVVRSSWELAVADLLVEAQIEYEYEAEKFEWGGDHVYTPDFFVDGYVIEIKGHVYGSEPEKARAAMEGLDQREYVVIGEELPCDTHIPFDEYEQLLGLFE